MTGLVKNWKTDSVKENDGVAHEYPDSANDDGTIPTFWLRRMGCDEHNKANEKLFKPFRAQQRLKQLSNTKQTDLLRDAFAIGCIANWQNVQDEKGVEIPFSPDNAVALIAGMPDLYYDLNEKSNNKRYYLAEVLEEEAKN